MNNNYVSGILNLLDQVVTDMLILEFITHNQLMLLMVAAAVRVSSIFQLYTNDGDLTAIAATIGYRW